MSIWRQLYGSLSGGWKTWGPQTIAGSGAFDSADSPFESVTADTALKLSAFWACLNLRAETIGSLPIHLRDDKKQVVRDHPLYSVLHDRPNSMMTAPEYWSMQTAHVDMHGNAVSVIQRRTRDKSVISLEPVADPNSASMHQRKSGAWFYQIGDEKFDADDILHLRGFSMDGLRGLPRIDIGRHILASQLSSNDAAMRAFKQGLKVGGFFKVEQSLNEPELQQFKARLDHYGLPENAGKWMALLKGMEPVGGAQFHVKPSDAELLGSRHFGIEEICRLCNVPPQLIGHTDKASSWASSIEHINLFFLMYSLQPTFIRSEASIRAKLLTSSDRARAIAPKFAIQGLLRSDMKTQTLMFASALQNGYYNRNEVRDLLDRAEIEGGDEYTIQLNMGKLPGVEKDETEDA